MQLFPTSASENSTVIKELNTAGVQESIEVASFFYITEVDKNIKWETGLLPLGEKVVGYEQLLLTFKT